MKMFTGALCGLVLAAGILPAHAADTSKIDERLSAASGILDEIMGTPDRAIPETILSKAHCVIVIPSEKKAAFLVGAQYGQGVATCRTGHGWSGPVFVKLGGGSFGFQIGGQATDVVLLGMNPKSAEDMLHSKVKLGADAAASAGPVGRNAQAATDLYLNAEFLTYSRSKGLFAGLDLTGEYLGANEDDTHAEYGSGVRNDAILKGAVPPPANAQHFVHTVAKYFVVARENH
ncbi:MAG: lipid-binding SYLF domain-containing protein [Janthinobacterium lividum]